MQHPVQAPSPNPHLSQIYRFCSNVVTLCLGNMAAGVSAHQLVGCLKKNSPNAPNRYIRLTRRPATFVFGARRCRFSRYPWRHHHHHHRRQGPSSLKYHCCSAARLDEISHPPSDGWDCGNCNVSGGGVVPSLRHARVTTTPPSLWTQPARGNHCSRPTAPP